TFDKAPLFSFKTGFRTKTYSYEEVLDIVKRFFSFFEAKNLKKGDRIIVLSQNRPEYAMLVFGALINSITLVPIDYRTNKETIKKFIEKTTPKAIFTSKVFAEQFMRV